MAQHQNSSVNELPRKTTDTPQPLQCSRVNAARQRLPRKPLKSPSRNRRVKKTFFYRSLWTLGILSMQALKALSSIAYLLRYTCYSRQNFVSLYCGTKLCFSLKQQLPGSLYLGCTTDVTAALTRVPVRWASLEDGRAHGDPETSCEPGSGHELVLPIEFQPSEFLSSMLRSCEWGLPWREANASIIGFLLWRTCG